MRTRRLITSVLIIGLVSSLCACSPIVDDEPQVLTYYATFYPIYALSSMVTGDIPDLELHCLVQPQDGCLRSYNLSDWDLYLLTYSANAVLAGGNGLESFIDTLESMADSRFSLVESMYGLSFYQGEQNEDESSHFSGDNPHLYMSSDGAIQILQNLAASLAILDPKYAETYEKNANEAIDQLKSFRDDVSSQTASCAGKKVAILNEALIYVAQDYQMEIVAVIEREAGIDLYDDELEKCLSELMESNAEVVLIEQQAPKPLTDAIEAAGFSVARLDILSTHTESDGYQGYFDAQESNAEILAETCSN